MENNQLIFYPGKKVMKLPFLCAVLFLLTFFLYSGVKKHEFVRYDDFPYIVDNVHVSQGLSFDNIKWAFSSFSEANWHPLTWISHMIDCDLFGLDPGKHHLMNVFFHALNTLLVFLFFYFLFSKEKNAKEIGFFCALIFSFHPLKIESVAWASERKDVLSTLFCLLTALTYLFYVKNISLQKKSRLFYGLMSIFFISGLLAKPMLVTLPFMLLLLDFWPLQRTFTKQVFAEKIPLLIFCFFSSVMTLMAQQQGGGRKDFLGIFPFKKNGQYFSGIRRLSPQLLFPV